MLPTLSRKLEPSSIQDYFSLGYVPEPKTIYQNTYKMRPGHTLTLRRDEAFPEQKIYWDLKLDRSLALSEEEASEELVSRLKEAVNIRMVSEVPLGAFLSGGVDSGAVVAMMASHSHSPVNTCSIGFDVDSFDETSYANQVAKQYRTHHFEQTVASDDFSLVDQLSQLYDEPYADSSAIPTYRVCQLAKGQVTVALSGDGGDEHFAGYRRYCWHMNEERLRATIPLSMREKIFGPLARVYPKADWAPRIFRAKTTFEALARNSVEAYFHSVSLTSDQQRNDLFSTEFKRSLADYDSRELFHYYADKADTEDPLALIQYLDIKTYLVGDILTKVDRASMAHGLEVRVPLLDHPFIEWIAQLPSSLKLRGQNGKYILKKAMEPYLPHDVLYRKKMGFGVPLAQWFRGPLRPLLKARLMGSIMEDSGFFQMASIETLIEQHLCGIRDHSTPLWSLFMFESFLRSETESTGVSKEFSQSQSLTLTASS